MVEALGLAGMTETPLVIAEVQRAGPSTGLPTRTEQSDLEFVLYAKRNPGAAEKLAASVQRQREWTIAMLEHQYASIGAKPNFPAPVLAILSIGLFEGLSIGRLADPTAFTQDVLTEVLTFLYQSIGVDDPEPAGDGAP